MPTDKEKNVNCGPEGHDTPDSMNHYSREETAIAESMEYPRAAVTMATKVTTAYKIRGAAVNDQTNTGSSSAGQDEVLSLKGNNDRRNMQLEHKLPPNFSQTIHSGRSSIKPEGGATTDVCESVVVLNNLDNTSEKKKSFVPQMNNGLAAEKTRAAANMESVESSIKPD